MSVERRIVCWVQLVIECTSWEAPKSIKTLYISPQRKPKRKQAPVRLQITKEEKKATMERKKEKGKQKNNSQINHSKCEQ